VGNHNRRTRSAGGPGGGAGSHTRGTRSIQKRQRAATSLTQSTPAGCCSAHFLYSACRLDSPCLKLASAKSRNRQRTRRVHVRHMRLRASCIGAWASRSCSARERLRRLASSWRSHKSLIFMTDVGVLTTYAPRASQSWRTISSSSPSPTALRRSAREPWSADPFLGDVLLFHRCLGFIYPIFGTGAGAQMVPRARWAPGGISLEASA
jgi:hypothetical protein